MEPLDAADPRFTAAPPRGASPSQRRLVPSRGPGPDPEDPLVRRLRVALPAVFFTAVAVIGLVFFFSLQPGDQSEDVGGIDAVRSAVTQRPHRVCLNGNNPCAWLTLVDGEVVAFNTSGPLPQEYGRDGVRWCPTSGWFGANATGSRFDQRGQVARGPAPRGLDRFGIHVEDGRVVVDFTELTAGVQRGQVVDLTPPAGPECDTIPFDRDADLVLPAP